MERREIPHDPRHLGVPLGASKMIFEPMVHSTQTLHLSSVKIRTISKQTKLLLEPCHLGVPSGASKMISESMVRLAEIVHLSCVDTNTVSKWKEVRSHTTYVTYMFHWVRPNQFLSLWNVRRKPCSYLASRLTVSPKRPKRAST
jgi:hypothetical protein